MSTLMRSRHGQLRHHLDAADAAAPTTVDWLRGRVAQYAAAAGVAVRVVLDAAEYAQTTGVHVGAWTAGDAYTGPPGARVAVPVVYLRPTLMPTRGNAELVIAHEVMHVRWPSYGHKQIAFDRAQQLLDQLA